MQDSAFPLLGLGGVGVLYLLAGYRCLRLSARVAAALLLAGLAAHLSPGVQNGLLRLGLVLGAGVVGFLLGNAFYFVVVVLYGAAAGAVLTVLVSGATGATSVHPLLLVVGLAGGGLLAFVSERPFVIFATSVLGAFLLAGLVQLGVAGSLPRVATPSTLGWITIASWAGLAALGCVAQAKTTRKMPPPAGKPAKAA